MSEYSDDGAVVWEDPGQGIRRLRGHVIDDGVSEFITVERRDGTHKIARRLVLKIEIRGRR